jgi:hypothetical protein
MDKEIERRFGADVFDRVKGEMDSHYVDSDEFKKYLIQDATWRTVDEAVRGIVESIKTHDHRFEGVKVMYLDESLKSRAFQVLRSDGTFGQGDRLRNLSVQMFVELLETGSKVEIQFPSPSEIIVSERKK